MSDRYLLEAMREVDEMLPGTPPIAPPRAASDWMNLLGGGVINRNNHVVLTHEEVMLCRAHGLPLVRYAEIKQARMMQNAARPTETLDSDGRPIGRT